MKKSFIGNIDITGRKVYLHTLNLFTLLLLINFHTKNKFKKIRLKPANQFRLMIFNFCKEFQNPGYSMYNYEDDLLCQARIMDAARQSDEKKRPIFLKEIK